MLKTHLEIKISGCTFRDIVEKEMQYWSEKNPRTGLDNEDLQYTINTFNFTNCIDRMVWTEFRERLGEDSITDPHATISTNDSCNAF